MDDIDGIGRALEPMRGPDRPARGAEELHGFGDQQAEIAGNGATGRVSEQSSVQTSGRAFISLESTYKPQSRGSCSPILLSPLALVANERSTTARPAN